MSADAQHIRTQTLANAKLLIKPTTPGPCNCSITCAPPSLASQTTLVPPPSSPFSGDLDIVVFGSGNKFTAAVMVGLTPAIEGEPGISADLALRKLFSATCELLDSYIPKVGSHQRNIHGGGVFDEDMISPEIVEAQKKSP